MYIGETGRMLEKRPSESNDTNNGIAVHAWKTQHKVDWEAVTVKPVETNYTRRRAVEAIHIRQEEVTSHHDCGRHLSPVGQPLICPPQGHNHP